MKRTPRRGCSFISPLCSQPAVRTFLPLACAGTRPRSVTSRSTGLSRISCSKFRLWRKFHLTSKERAAKKSAPRKTYTEGPPRPAALSCEVQAWPDGWLAHAHHRSARGELHSAGDRSHHGLSGGNASAARELACGAPDHSGHLARVPSLRQTHPSGVFARRGCYCRREGRLFLLDSLGPHRRLPRHR